MNNSQMLLCPLCVSVNGRHTVIAKVLPDGAVAITRFHTGTTIIRGPHVSASCQCGYSVFLQGTVIEGTALINI